MTVLRALNFDQPNAKHTTSALQRAQKQPLKCTYKQTRTLRSKYSLALLPPQQVQSVLYTKTHLDLGEKSRASLKYSHFSRLEGQLRLKLGASACKWEWLLVYQQECTELDFALCNEIVSKSISIHRSTVARSLWPASNEATERRKGTSNVVSKNEK